MQAVFGRGFLGNMPLGAGKICRAALKAEKAARWTAFQINWIAFRGADQRFRLAASWSISSAVLKVVAATL